MAYKRLSDFSVLDRHDFLARLYTLAAEHYEAMHDGKRDTHLEIWRIESAMVDLAYEIIGKKVGE